MATTVKFLSEKYGNYQDNYYTDNYTALITTLLTKVKFTREVNLGVTNGVILENNFNGDFQAINCAIVEHDMQGNHLYKIIKKVFIKRNLWRITMVKDLVSSKYQGLLSSDVLVSRLGISRTTFDPLLFQKDVLDLSEVKKGQVLLGELAGVKSYGYLAIWKRDSLNGTDIKWNSTARGATDYDISVTNIADFPGYSNREFISGIKSVVVKISDSVAGKFSITVSVPSSGPSTKIIRTTGIVDPMNYTSVKLQDYKIEDRLESRCANHDFGLTYGSVDANVGKVVYESSSGKYYTVSRKKVARVANASIPDVDIAYVLNATSYVTVNTGEYFISEQVYKYDFTLIRTVPLIEKTLSAYASCVDQPFQMFFIPIIEDATLRYDGKDYVSSKMITEAMLYDLIGTYSGEAGKLLDVQVVPYMPVEGLSTNWNSATKVFTVESDSLVDIATPDTEDYIVPIYSVLYASYSTYIPYVRTVEDYKIEQKRKYLITSPSGATAYDFSVAKNDGITGFFVDIDLRPFATFHRVQPNFGSLYGSTYRDTRGLIWQEDTSLTMVSSAWETYKRQNVNYMNTFNTDINYKRSALAIDQEANWGNYGFDAGKRIIVAGIEAVTFTAEAIAQDIFFGAKGAMSGGVGAAVIMGGALLGEALESSQVAYNNAMDTKKLTNEINTSRQQFNYNIGNIKAIPENVEKVNGVFNTNNYVPYVQEFEPTLDEIAYYNRYLDLFGVNVGMMVDLSVKTFDYVQGSVLKFSEPITNEEYIELHAQLSRGARKIGMEE